MLSPPLLSQQPQPPSDLSLWYAALQSTCQPVSSLQTKPCAIGLFLQQWSQQGMDVVLWPELVKMLTGCMICRDTSSCGIDLRKVSSGSSLASTACASLHSCTRCVQTTMYALQCVRRQFQWLWCIVIGLVRAFLGLGRWGVLPIHVAFDCAFLCKLKASPLLQ